MQKIFLIVVLFISAFLANFCLAAGQTDPVGAIATGAGYSTDVDDTSLAVNIGGIIGIILGMIGVIFFVLTFFAGYLWLTAAGNEEKIEKAKSILSASVIGLIIILLSYGLTTLIIQYVSTSSSPVTTVGN